MYHSPGVDAHGCDNYGSLRHLERSSGRRSLYSEVCRSDRGELFRKLFVSWFGYLHELPVCSKCPSAVFISYWHTELRRHQPLLLLDFHSGNKFVQAVVGRTLFIEWNKFRLGYR
jgi:hypothetical protein